MPPNLRGREGDAWTVRLASAEVRSKYTSSKYSHDEYSLGRGERGKRATQVVITCACTCTQALPLRAWAVAMRIQAASLRIQVSVAGELHKLLVEDDPGHAASYVWRHTNPTP